MTVGESFNNFIYEKRLSGLTQKSLDSYKQHAGMFIKFVGADMLLDNLTRKDIDSYRESLLNRGLSMGTIASYTRDMKIYLKYLEVTYSKDYSTATIKSPRTPKTLPRIYTAEDIQLIYKNIVAESEWLTYRNRAIIMLMYDSGLRQSEICKLKICDINFDINMLRVNGKGNKTRNVPMGISSKSLILKYLSLCPYKSEYVFVNRYGDKTTTNTIKQLCSKISRNLPFEFSSHKLRHNYATNYCLDRLDDKEDVDIYALKNLMGHEEISTTERYLHLAQGIFASTNHISHLDKLWEKLA